VSCGLTWLCPVCASKIAARRAEEVEQALTAHLAGGGGAEFLTLTLPHTAGDRLAHTRQLAADGWKKVQQGRGWKALKTNAGIVGTVRALEVTQGANGWHPHLHVLLFTQRHLDRDERQQADDALFASWRRAVVAQGHAAPQSQCTTLEPVTDSEIARYATKVGTVLELTQGASKQGRNGSRTPFEILADFLIHGDADDLALWQEYELAMRGARQLTWSRGLKARYALPDVSDETLAQQEVGGELVALIAADEWGMVVATAGMRVRLLEAAERGGADAVDALLATLPRPPAGLRLAG
jgi:hypothetical protein